MCVSKDTVFSESVVVLNVSPVPQEPGIPWKKVLVFHTIRLAAGIS